MSEKQSDLIYSNTLEHHKHFWSVLTFCKLGRPPEECFSHIGASGDLINAIYKNYAWLLGKYESKVINNQSRIVAKYSDPILALFYCRQHLQPRHSNSYGTEVLWHGYYRQYSRHIRNAIESYLGFLGIAKPNIDQSVINESESIKYCPVRDYYNSIDTLIKSSGVQNGDPLFDFLKPFLDEKRILASTDQEISLVMQKIKIWGVYAVAQVMDDDHINDVALGAISQKQGSGKSLFMQGITWWARKRRLVTTASYGSGQDTQRKLKSNAFLHDDELSERTKKALENFKETLSMKYSKYTEKYEVQELENLRLCSFTYCANNTEFLKEDSRRDYTIRFAETDVFDAERIASHCKNQDINDRLWAYFLYLYQYKFTTVTQEYHQIKDAVNEGNKEYLESSLETDLLQRYFFEPADTTKDPWYGFQIADIVSLLNNRIAEDLRDYKTTVNERKIKDAIRSMGWVTVPMSKRRAWSSAVSNTANSQARFKAYRLSVIPSVEHARAINASAEAAPY